MYDENTMAPLDNLVSCFKTLIIQMQAINDHLSWISQKERQSHMTPEGFPIKCEVCKEIYKHDILPNAADLIRGMCGKCANRTFRDIDTRISEEDQKIIESKKKEYEDRFTEEQKKYITEALVMAEKIRESKKELENENT
jgi:hypothetical protein